VIYAYEKKSNDMRKMGKVHQKTGFGGGVGAEAARIAD
jgi:hypothetical protein